MNLKILGVLLCFVLVGCSAKQRIYDGATKVNQLASSSRDSATEIIEISNQPEVVAIAGEIVSDQEEILKVSEAIKEASTHVRDIVPWWARMLEWAGILLAIVAAVYFTWVYIVPIRMLIGRFIPARRRAATMLRKVHKGDIDVREYIANWRSDPANEAAYRADQRKEALRG